MRCYGAGISVGAAVAALAAGILTAPAALSGDSASNSSSRSPVLHILRLFTSSKVPELAPGETPVPERKWTRSVPPDLPGKGMAQHPMFYIGEGYNKMLLVNGGRIIWTYSTGPGWEYDDSWMLSNGNILFTRMQYVAEITPDKKIVWRYDAPAGTEIHTCQPIGRDRVVFIQNGLPPRLFVVNIKNNKVEVQHDLAAISLTDQKTVHGQFRRVRYTARGTYLIPFLEMGRVVEYDKSFREIWSYDVPTPWAAIRLKNGNTLITDERDVLTLEVSPQKKTVWEIKPDELPEAYRYANSQSATRLANGNTILCSRGGDVEGPQLIEVTRDKKVVWVLQDWEHFGPATSVQILDEPGIPEHPGDLEQ